MRRVHMVLYYEGWCLRVFLIVRVFLSGERFLGHGVVAWIG